MYIYIYIYRYIYIYIYQDVLEQVNRKENQSWDLHVYAGTTVFYLSVCRQ